jgi:hypothetical protein
MQTLGQFIVERRKELGLAGREVVAEVRNSDGKPISIPFLVDLEDDRRKPPDEVPRTTRQGSEGRFGCALLFGRAVSSRPQRDDSQWCAGTRRGLEGVPAGS